MLKVGGGLDTSSNGLLLNQVFRGLVVVSIHCQNVTQYEWVTFKSRFLRTRGGLDPLAICIPIRTD